MQHGASKVCKNNVLFWRHELTRQAAAAGTGPHGRIRSGSYGTRPINTYDAPQKASGTAIKKHDSPACPSAMAVAPTDYADPQWSLHVKYCSSCN